MDEAVRSLKGRRIGILVLNLAYFAALLVLGFLLFRRNMTGPVLYGAVVLCVAAYIFGVRRASKSYTRSLRDAILRYAVCAGWEDVRHEAKSGVSRAMAMESGLVPSTSDTVFMSREHITGTAGPIRAELADVTFPIGEGGRNAMFNGCFIRLTWPGARFDPVTVRGGQIDGELPAAQRRAVEELGSCIPGSLYLRTEGDRLDILLRGRFLGFPVNLLMPVTEKSLTADPLPEVGQSVRLARLLRR